MCRSPVTARASEIRGAAYRKIMPALFPDRRLVALAGRPPTMGRRVQEVAFLGKAKLLPGMDSRTGVAYTIIVSNSSLLTHAGTSPRPSPKLAN